MQKQENMLKTVYDIQVFNNLLGEKERNHSATHPIAAVGKYVAIEVSFPLAKQIIEDLRAYICIHLYMKKYVLILFRLHI